MLSHPSIVKIIDVCFNDAIQYIVMEYIDGITLKEYIEQQGTVKWKEAVHFSVQILRALQHAHDNGIVHRDVKPQNVMLLEDGTIKVMDFGIARFARENGKTMSDKAIGSVHYISPEQAKGDTTDERTDIYAVGVIIYEMLTGKVPFDGDSPVSIAIKQMQIQPQRPRLINPEIPVGLEEIILRAMQKDTGVRYQTASEMLRDIDEFKKNPTVLFEYKYLDDNNNGTTKYFEKIDSQSMQNRSVREEKPMKKSYVLNILAGVTAACVLVAIVAVIFFFKMAGNKTPDFEIINIEGKTVQWAQEKMSNVNIVVVSEELSSEYEKGLIIEQDPPANTKVKGDSDINVVVSLGIEALRVPDVVDDAAGTAKQKLETLGLYVEQVSTSDDKVEIGNVTKTVPPADSELQKGDTVVIYVSTGAVEMPVYIPDITGMTDIEARSFLAQRNFRMGTAEIVESTEPAGTIVEQTPEADTKSEKGATIDVKISNGVGESGGGTGESGGVINDGELAIQIDFPLGEIGKDEYKFEVFVNDVSVRTTLVYPKNSTAFLTMIYVENGLINGLVPPLGGDEVVIKVDDAEFAKYVVDFDLGASSVTMQPKFELMYPHRYQS